MERNGKYMRKSRKISLISAILAGATIFGNNYLPEKQEEGVSEEVYVEHPLPQVTLEEIIGDAVRRFPDRLDGTKYVVTYFTAKGDWCPPCNQIKKQGDFFENVSEKNKDAGVLKFEMPQKEEAPNVFSNMGISGVPQIRIYLLNEGKMTYYGEVSAPWENVAQKTQNFLENIVAGKVSPPGEIRIEKEKFRNHHLGFDPRTSDENQKYPLRDQLGIIRALTLFGEEKVHYGNGEVLVSLNLGNWIDFEFADIYDIDVNPPRNTNRGVLGKTRATLWKKSIEEAKSNKECDAEKNAINKEGAKFWKADVTQIEEIGEWTNNYWEFHRRMYEDASKHTPGYIVPYLNNYATESFNNFSGEGDDFVLIENSTHPLIKDSFRTWAEKNKKQLTIKKFPTIKEIEDWGEKERIPKDDVQGIQDTLTRLNKMYSSFENSGIIYADTLTPIPPIIGLLGERKIAVYRDSFSVGSLEDFERRYGGNKRENLLRSFIGASQNYRDRMFLYLPHNRVQIRFTHPIGSGGPGSITDPFSDRSYGDSIYFGTSGSELFSEIDGKIGNYEIEIEEKMKKIIEGN